MRTHDHGPNSCGRRHHDSFSRMASKFGFGPGMPPHGLGGHGGMRARRGGVRHAILRLLSEKPMHGYQIIQELAARSEGTWTPSAGSVYPTLQLLADEGLVVADLAEGKKVFRLTEEGAAAVAESADQPAPWEDAARFDSGFGEYREAVGKMTFAVMQIGRTGTKEQKAAAIEIINDARKKLYALLAED